MCEKYNEIILSIPKDLKVVLLKIKIRLIYTFPKTRVPHVKDWILINN